MNAYRKKAIYLANQYYPDDPEVIKAASESNPQQFLRLFITAHGMKPTGIWQSHTYVQYEDVETFQKHFFLIPVQNATGAKQPHIRIQNNQLKIDDVETNIVPQSIPHTTPFWYFHYDPNNAANPYHSMTLNLSPSCLEKCVLCAGAKTGRVNNGMENTLSAKTVLKRIFDQHPDALRLLD
ncbi:MAG TPA: hypothetical protein VHM20_03255, partial [Gammaproteobacteria bacterium]|nr:hypothetical protein [Gammaproteobacteria bacterium]